MATRVSILTSTGRESESMSIWNSISFLRSIHSARSRTRKRWHSQNVSRQSASRLSMVTECKTGKPSSRVHNSWQDGSRSIVKVESAPRSQPSIVVLKCFTPWRNILKSPIRPSSPLKRSMLISAVGMWSSFAPSHTASTLSQALSARTRQAVTSACSRLLSTMLSVKVLSETIQWRNWMPRSAFSQRMARRNTLPLRNLKPSWQPTVTAQRSSKPSSLLVSLDCDSVICTNLHRFTFSRLLTARASILTWKCRRRRSLSSSHSLKRQSVGYQNQRE